MIKIIYILVLMPICMFIPGYLLSRKSKFSDDIKLVQSVSLSVMVIYLVSFAFYLLEFNKTPYIIFSSSLIVIAIIIRKELCTFFSSATVKPLLLHYSTFVVWILLLTMFIRHYSGGGWFGDWEEHYCRSLFFKDHYPLDITFIGHWGLTARPPLYNIVASFFLMHAGNEFYYYQVTSILLNTLVFFGAFAALCSLANKNIRRVQSSILILTVLLCLNPSVVQNVTFVWTRSLANFFIIYSVALFFMSIRQKDTSLRKWSYLNMGLATLTHYSAFPYLLGLGVVDLYLLTTRRVSILEAIKNYGIFLLTFSSWLLFALYNYGPRVTFSANSTVIDSASYGVGENVFKIFRNVGNTFVPPVFGTAIREFIQQDHLIGYIRDYAFMIYQVNFLFMFGSIGWLIVLVGLVTWSARSYNTADRENIAILWLFLVLVILSGIASHGAYDAFGLGHICLQPLSIIGLVYIAANFEGLNKTFRRFMYVALWTDFLLGVVIHFWILHFRPEDVFSMAQSGFALSGYAVSNSLVKVEGGYLFVADSIHSNYMIGLLLIALGVVIASVLRFHKNNINDDSDFT